MYVFTFLLSAVAFMLLAFSLHLFFTKQGSRMLNILLSVPLLARFVQVCIFLVITASYQNIFPFFQQISVPLFFAAPACSYLYVKYFIVGQTYFKRADLLHFLPVLFGLMHILPFTEPIDWNGVAAQIIAGGQLSIKISTGFFSMRIYHAVLFALSVGYLIASWYKIISSGFLREKWDINKTWICFYLSTSTFFKLLSFVALVFNVMERSYINNSSFLIISCAVLLFTMVFVLYQPRILYGYILLSANHIQTQDTVKTDLQNKSWVDKLSLDQEQLQRMDAIKTFVETEKPFLQPDFQMKDLSAAVNISAHHCSLVINTVTGKNFRDWLNSYRIQYFIKEYPALADTKTIEAVALQAGFRNITTFYNAFKKENGQMPKAYFNFAQ